MLFVNYKIDAPRDEVLRSLDDNNTIVEEEKFDVSNGRPKMHIKLKNEWIRISCEMIDGPSKDRDFKLGTKFWGRISEHGGTTKIQGIALTAPLYHLILLIMFAFFIYKCISLGGFSVVPVCLVVFDVFMFMREFKKQGIIKRYIFRALKITYRRLNANTKEKRQIS